MDFKYRIVAGNKFFAYLGSLIIEKYQDLDHLFLRRFTLIKVSALVEGRSKKFHQMFDIY